VVFVVKENLTTLLGAKVQQMKLIDEHEDNFEKVAATFATSKKAQIAQEVIEKFSDLLKVIKEH